MVFVNFRYLVIERLSFRYFGSSEKTLFGKGGSIQSGYFLISAFRNQILVTSFPLWPFSNETSNFNNLKNHQIKKTRKTLTII